MMTGSKSLTEDVRLHLFKCSFHFTVRGDEEIVDVYAVAKDDQQARKKASDLEFSTWIIRRYVEAEPDHQLEFVEIEHVAMVHVL